DRSTRCPPFPAPFRRAWSCNDSRIARIAHRWAAKPLKRRPRPAHRTGGRANEERMHEIQAEFTFAAAHRLPRYQGKCANLHGHNYRLSVTLRGEPDPYSGIFVDLGDVEKAVREQILAKCDHANLNDFIENPTAEAVAA